MYYPVKEFTLEPKLTTFSTMNYNGWGETTLSLQKRMNIHSKGKFGYKHLIKHSKNNCAASSFIVQISEIFPGIGYRNDKSFTAERPKRLKREDY